MKSIKKQLAIKNEDLSSNPRIKSLFLIIGILTSFIALTSSCKKANDYFEVLRNEPEILNTLNYDRVYSIGDTLVIYGRFISDDLTIKVGDAEALIIEKVDSDRLLHAQYSTDKIQRIKILIDKAMGIGNQKPIRLTASGITINGSSIDIVEDMKTGVLANSLTVEKLADYPIGAIPVYCNSGNGNMYFLDTTKNTVSLLKMDQIGQTSILPFNPYIFKDSDGNPFTVSTFSGLAIDPQEKHLYLSVYEKAPRRSYWHYYRLCRYDLETGEFVVMNKTPYNIYNNKRTIDNLVPFEGKINEVKMFAATDIYPDEVGNIYFNISNKFITYLDKEGNYSYKIINTHDNYLNNEPEPKIYDAQQKKVLFWRESFHLYPGLPMYFANFYAINPEQHIAYFNPGIYSRNAYLGTTGYDLKNQKEIGTVDQLRRGDNSGYDQKIYYAGSIQSLTRFNRTVGFLPHTEYGLIQFIDEKASNTGPGNTALQVLDFAKNKGYLYATGVFDFKKYNYLEGIDKVLNYDNQGMLYMTSDNRTVILKTIKK